MGGKLIKEKVVSLQKLHSDDNEKRSVLELMKNSQVHIADQVPVCQNGR